MIPDSTLDEMLALAESATPGPWEVVSDLPTYAIYAKGGHRVVQTLNQNDGIRSGMLPTVQQCVHRHRDGIEYINDGKFIAACSPETITGLIARLRNAEREREELRPRYEYADRMLRYQQDYYASWKATEKERDELRTRIAEALRLCDLAEEHERVGFWKAPEESKGNNFLCTDNDCQSDDLCAPRAEAIRAALTKANEHGPDRSEM